MNIEITCLNTILVDRDKIEANDYNPNEVPRDKMELLKQSIVDNGFCFPIVTIYDDKADKYVIIDGFHRFTMCQEEWLDIKEVPVVVLKHDLGKRMAATVQFNKARGVHAVDGDADIVKGLIEQGWKDIDICKHLGITAETELRYKQMTGLLDLFKDVEYSVSWEVGDFKEEE